ncbi:hypothetical protein PFISCL1PPCAC_16543, partial [Pristionchus fissidentatus]
EAVLVKITAQFEFRSLNLEFIYHCEESVMNYALRSERCIDKLRISHCNLEPSKIIELPRMPDLAMTCCTGFSDDQLLALCRKEHRKLNVFGDLSDVSTFHRTNQIFHSSLNMEKLTLDLTNDYFHRFLASIKLREEEQKLWDDSNPNSPVLLFEIVLHKTFYFIDYQIGYLQVYTHARSSYRGTCVSVLKGMMPEKAKRFHSHRLNVPLYT